MVYLSWYQAIVGMSLVWPRAGDRFGICGDSPKAMSDVDETGNSYFGSPEPRTGERPSFPGECNGIRGLV